jgi:hypothetical protein
MTGYRGHKVLNLIDSAAYTTTQTSADKRADGYRGVRVFLDVTSNTSGELTMKIQGKTPQGDYIDLLEDAQVTTATNSELILYPGIAVTANVSASTVLTRIWRVVVTAADSGAATYSVKAELLP